MYEPVNSLSSPNASASLSREGLFTNISFYVHPNGDNSKETERLLTEHSGNLVMSPEVATYVISNSTFFANLEKFVVITNEWVQMCVEHQAILPAQPYLVGKEKLFGSVVFCLGEDFTDSDREALFSMLTYYGGCFNDSIKECTHHITLGKEKQTFYYDKQKHIQPSIKVVSPLWVKDSVKYCKLQPEAKYKHTPDPSTLRLVLPPIEMQESINTPGPNDISSPVLKIITSPLVSREIANHSAHVTALYQTSSNDANTEFPPLRHFSYQQSQDSVTSMSTSPSLSQGYYPQIMLPTVYNKLADAISSSDKMLASPSIISTPHTPEPASTDSHPEPTQFPVPSQPMNQLTKSSCSSAGDPASRTERSPREKPSLFHKFDLFFDGFAELIGKDTQREWERIVVNNGARVSPIYNDNVTHVILRHAMCDAYSKALRDCKFIASAYWLNDVLLKEQLFHPCAPLHIPIKNQKPKEMEGLKISVSNYEGTERVMVRDMISLLGANYTSYLSKKHDFLVANKAHGIKHSKAKEWKVPIVNARFLVDALFQPGIPDRYKNLYRNVESGDQLDLRNLEYMKPLLSVWTQHS